MAQSTASAGAPRWVYRLGLLQTAALILGNAGLTLQVTDAAREWLALNGFDPVYGARPLRRLVQSSIGDQLAKALLSGDIRDGDAVVVDAPEDFTGAGEGGLTVKRG